ncbi:MAG: nicotinate (nicotinamide) nucleotide adenylyltransferase [Oscillospiraceae bacterium]|nr:nicotinate (nicotinamide) nucleotide adenylyltransferase [Oscillospiraceae bacterium]
MRILIYGGSFNPPHLGHVRSANIAAAALEPDSVFFIPAAIPPHKELAAGSPSPSDRLAMTKLAATEVPGGKALDVELAREGKSYTSDTLRQLKILYPEAELVFLVGTDMLLTIDQWHEPEAVMTLASIAVFARETDTSGAVEKKARMLHEKYGATIYVLAGEPVEAASTHIRELLPLRQGKDLLSDSVYEYIIRRRLYGAKPNFDWLREQAYAYLAPKRIAHVQGTEQEARRLAERWGQNVEDAAEAAIVHDITKKLSMEEQLILCDKYDIILDECELTSEKLLHARTGAAFAAELFGCPEHIVQAVRWHTTGHPDMTALEQIIYLADYIEPGRNGFSGLAELREAAYQDLDMAMELGLRMSLAEVRAKGQAPHKNTADAQAWFSARLKSRGLEPVPWTADTPIPD